MMTAPPARTRNLKARAWTRIRIITILIAAMLGIPNGCCYGLETIAKYWSSIQEWDCNYCVWTPSASSICTYKFVLKSSCVSFWKVHIIDKVCLLRKMLRTTASLNLKLSLRLFVTDRFSIFSKCLWQNVPFAWKIVPRHKAYDCRPQARRCKFCSLHILCLHMDLGAT